MKLQKLRYLGPADQVNDSLGGRLVPGEVYDAPSKEAAEELLAHPAGWFEPAKPAPSKEN